MIIKKNSMRVEFVFYYPVKITFSRVIKRRENPGGQSLNGNRSSAEK